MNKKIFLIAAAALAFAPLLGAQNATAAPFSISCPAVVNTQVTTRLSPEWNTGTDRHRIRDTRVIDQRGRPQILECTYEDGVKISREAPRRSECRTDNRRGFNCFDARPRPRIVAFTGEETLNPRDVVNLDSPRRGTWDGDLWLDGMTMIDARLSTFGDATLAMPVRGEPGYEGCARQRYQSQAIRITELQEGDYLCVKTSEGRYSQIRINRVDLRGFVKVKIGFMTWDR